MQNSYECNVLKESLINLTIFTKLDYYIIIKLSVYLQSQINYERI